MKLVFLIGDAAVGKMTVGQELMKRTGLRLFHNHMTIEPVLEIFGYYHKAAIDSLRGSHLPGIRRVRLRGNDFYAHVGLRPAGGLGLCGACKGDIPPLWHRILLRRAGSLPGDSPGAERDGQPFEALGLQA